MKKYEAGAFMYHTTLPTDSLTAFNNSINDTYTLTLEVAEKNALQLGKLIRDICEKKGLKSVAAADYESPTVVVMYADDPEIVGKFKANGIQIAGGVPFKLDEPTGLITFRIGLFGIEKLENVNRTANAFEAALNNVIV